MKAQAAAYEEFTYGSYDEGFRSYCKNKEVRKNVRNYTGALRCVKKMQKEHDEKILRQNQAKAEAKKADFYEKRTKKLRREEYYDNCMSSKKYTDNNRKKCAKKANRAIK